MMIRCGLIALTILVVLAIGWRLTARRGSPPDAPEPGSAAPVPVASARIPFRSSEAPTARSEAREPAPVPAAPAPSSNLPSAVAAASAGDDECIRRLVELAEAVRKGDKESANATIEKLRKEVIPSPVPDERNAAPVYIEAFKCVGSPRPEELDAAYSRLVAEGDISAEEARALRGWVDASKPAIELLIRAAELSECRFPVDYARGWDMELPHLAKMKGAANLLAAHAALLRVQGDVAGAAETTRALLALAVATRREPVLISQLVGICISDMALESVRGLPPDRQAAIAAEFDRAAWRDGCRQALAWEAAATAARLFEDNAGRAPADPVIPQDQYEMFGPMNPARWVDAASYMETMARGIELVSHPYHRSREELQALQARLEREPAPWETIGPSFLPAFVKTSEAVARYESGVHMSRLALAFERHRARHGQYPETLETLGIPLPQDPLTGAPFEYRQEGDGFVLRSRFENEDVRPEWRSGVRRKTEVSGF